MERVLAPQHACATLPTLPPWPLRHTTGRTGPSVRPGRRLGVCKKDQQSTGSKPRRLAGRRTKCEAEQPTRAVRHPWRVSASDWHGSPWGVGDTTFDLLEKWEACRASWGPGVRGNKGLEEPALRGMWGAPRTARARVDAAMPQRNATRLGSAPAPSRGSFGDAAPSEGPDAEPPPSASCATRRRFRGLTCPQGRHRSASTRRPAFDCTKSVP